MANRCGQARFGDEEVHSITDYAVIEPTLASAASESTRFTRPFHGHWMLTATLLEPGPFGPASLAVIDAFSDRDRYREGALASLNDGHPFSEDWPSYLRAHPDLVEQIGVGDSPLYSTNAECRYYLTPAVLLGVLDEGPAGLHLRAAGYHQSFLLSVCVDTDYTLDRLLEAYSLFNLRQLRLVSYCIHYVKELGEEHDLAEHALEGFWRGIPRARFA